MRRAFYKMMWLLMLPLVGVLDAANATGALLEGKRISIVSLHKILFSDPQSGAQAPDVTVGAGVEVTNFPNAFNPEIPLKVNIDLSDRNILITAVEDQTPACQEVIRIFSGDPNFPFFPNIKRVLVNPATNWAGFHPIHVGGTRPDNGMLVSNAIDVTVSGLSGLQGQIISLDLIPEPAAAGLLLTSLAALAIYRRRRAPCPRPGVGM